MDEQTQQQFIQWLAKKTGAKTQQDLQKVLAKLQSNKGQMEQVIQQFQQEMTSTQEGQSAIEEPMYEKGGKLPYVDCLKKGGAVDCGCVKKGSKGTKVTSQANAGAIKSPKYPALGNKPIMFTKKEVDNMPNWETTTTPMRTMEKGGVLLAGRGARLLDRAKRVDNSGDHKRGTNMLIRAAKVGERETNRQDRRAEREINNRNEKLVTDYNYQGTEVAPGVFQRGRSQFDASNENMLANRRPLDGGDAGRGLYKASFPHNIAVENRPDMSPANFPSLVDRSQPGRVPLGVPSKADYEFTPQELEGIVNDAVNRTHANKATTLIKKPEAKAAPTKVNPANIKTKAPLGKAPVSTQNPFGTDVMLGNVDVVAPRIIKPGLGQAPITQQNPFGTDVMLGNIDILAPRIKKPFTPNLGPIVSVTPNNTTTPPKKPFIPNLGPVSGF